MLKRRLKEPFGKAGLTVAILALVLAMVGGAYAAGGLTKPQEKQVTKIAKKFAGKPGATGPAGTAGTNGTNGANGKIGKEGPVGSEGSPWTAGGTLPPGKSETGTWALIVPAANPAANALHLARSPISFLIPLPTEPTAHYLKACETKEEPEKAECEAEREPEEEACPGSPAAPTAKPGQLCVYAEGEFAAPAIAVLPHKFGAMVASNFGEPGGFADGSWAVTAE